VVTTGKMRGKEWGTTYIVPTCSVVDEMVAPSQKDNEHCADVFEISDHCHLPAKLGMHRSMPTRV